MEHDKQLTTQTVDLFVPADRFALASRLHGHLHRWRILLGKSWWVLGLMVLAVNVPVFVLTLLSPPVYQSNARMWLAGKLDIREGRLYTEEAIDYLGTQAELLRSPAIQTRALARLNAPIAGDGASSSFPFQVKVQDARKSSILELRASGPESTSTRAFLNHLMDEYLQFKREARAKTSERTVTSVAAQVTELARELETRQEKLHAFQSSNNIVFLQEQGNSAGNYLAILNRRLANLHTELSLLRALLPEQWIETKGRNGTVSMRDEPADESAAREMMAGLAGPQLELFKAGQQMQLLKAKRDELSRFLRPLHPKIIKLEEEIQTQERLAQIARDEAAKQMTYRRQAIELEIQNLETVFREWDAKAIQASRKMADYDRIRQDLHRIQAAYDKMLALIQTVDLSKNVEQENVGVLEPASLAKPINRMLRNMAAAVAGSALLGFGFLYGWEKFRDDFSSVAELRQQLREEVIGQVPSITMKEFEGRMEPATLEEQRFEFLESFRDIRSSLLFMGNGRPKPKTIMIASSVPAEGKSTVALYLAATMAMSNSRVLLVDADLRQGTLHEHFGVVSRPGLAEILNRESSPEKAIVRTDLDNLALLPAGEAKRNPGELLLSQEWVRFVAEMKDRYDYILLDTPPVAAANDAVVMAPTLDGVLFVVRASFTPARTAGEALMALRQRHARVLGLVLNRTVASVHDNYGYHRYTQKYGWSPKPPRPAGALVGESGSDCKCNSVG